MALACPGSSYTVDAAPGRGLATVDGVVAGAGADDEGERLPASSMAAGHRGAPHDEDASAIALLHGLASSVVVFEIRLIDDVAARLRRRSVDPLCSNLSATKTFIK